MLSFYYFFISCKTHCTTLFKVIKICCIYTISFLHNSSYLHNTNTRVLILYYILYNLYYRHHSIYKIHNILRFWYLQDNHVRPSMLTAHICHLYPTPFFPEILLQLRRYQVHSFCQYHHYLQSSFVLWNGNNKVKTASNLCN